MNRLLPLAALALALLACNGERAQVRFENRNEVLANTKMTEYAEVPLSVSIAHLSPSEQLLLQCLIEAAEIFDKIYWVQSFGNKADIDTIADARLRHLVHLNYGPWERLGNNNSFVPGYTRKPPGHNFYPSNMTMKEYAALDNPSKASPYTMLRRDILGQLRVIPYSEFFASDLQHVSNIVREVAPLTSNQNFSKYLKLLADALLTDKYQACTEAWMDCYSSHIDFIAGPIENGDDVLFGNKLSFEALLLLRDSAQSAEVERLNCLTPKLQELLPCDDQYKIRPEHCQADYGVYDVLYLAGEANVPFLPMVVSLPNEKDICIEKGRRKLINKNILKARFNAIMKPIAELLIDHEQSDLVTHKAFFNNAIFRELTYGPIVAYAEFDTIMAQQSSTTEYIMDIEEARTSISTLFVAQQLHQMGELHDLTLQQCYVTYLADLLRQVRFGTSTASGRANMLILGYLQNMGAVERTTADKYRVNFRHIENGVNQLLSDLLQIQITRNYSAATVWIVSRKFVEEALFYDLLKLVKAKVPRDIRVRQGVEELGLKRF